MDNVVKQTELLEKQVMNNEISILSIVGKI